MAHKDVVVHEEEDLGIAIQKLEIPLSEFDQNSVGSVNSLTEDDISAIIDDQNFMLDGSQDHSRNKNSSDSQTVTKEGSLGPKLPRNKRGRRKRRPFKSVACLFNSEVDKTCLHCGMKDTPLWRKGPRGAGTLCNACGLRYRTGWLLPEYRPASSPGFKPNAHSNFHRRVLQIRSERDSLPNDFAFEGFQQ